MAEVIGRVQIETYVTLKLSMQELGALEAIAGYGTDNFIKFFYKHMGEHYLRPYVGGLKSLFEEVRHGQARRILNASQDAQAVFYGTKVAKHPPLNPRHEDGLTMIPARTQPRV